MYDRVANTKSVPIRLPLVTATHFELMTSVIVIQHILQKKIYSSKKKYSSKKYQKIN